MMRYRLLTREELEALEADVVQFLAESGVTAVDWESWKSNGDKRIEELLAAFSEQFWDRATSKVHFLERTTGDETWLFALGDTEAKLIRCVVDPNTNQVTWYEGGKSYPEEARGHEVFLLLEQGAHPVEEERWIAVNSAKSGASLN